MTIPFEFYFDSLLLKLATGAAWRNGVAAKHPGDPRNIKAAAELTRLSRSRFSDVTHEAWEELSPHVEDEAFVEAINVAVRNVGFRSRPADINSFVLSVAEVVKTIGPIGADR